MSRILLRSSLVALLVATACSSTDRSSGFNNGTDPGGPNTGGGTLGGNGSSGGNGTPCVPDPKNYDVPGNNCDDDGDGTVDNPPTCDSNVAQNGTAEDFARAIGICQTASKDGYGLVSAKFTQGYNRNDAPNQNQHGVLGKFGSVIKPREGARLGVLSTGYAQEFDGPANAPFGGSQGFQLNGKDWWGAGIGSGNGTAPPGFPKPAAGCPINSDVNDTIDLVLELKAPPNASGVKFDFNFYSGEWPAYVCTNFNDGFVAYLSAKGFNNGKPDNMSFDKNNNPVSVNNGFFDRCTPGVKTGCAGQTTSTSMCPGGESELLGTGFGISDQWCKSFGGSGNSDASTNGGATGWLTSQAPVNAGETFTLELMIWDTGDGVLDSSVLVDNFTWAAGQVTTSTERPR